MVGALLLVGLGNSKAQTTYKIKADAGVGMEQNIFYNPVSLQTDSGNLGRSDMYTAGPLMQTSLGATLEHKLSKKDQLEASMNGRLRQYLGNEDANRHRFAAKVRYERVLHKKLKAGVQMGYVNSRMLSRNGANDDEVRLLRYQDRYAGVDLLYKPLKQTQFRLGAKMGNKPYAADSGQLDLSNRYSEMSLFAFQRLHKKHAVSVRLAQTTRQYTAWSVRVLEELEELEEGEAPGRANLRMGFTRVKFAYKYTPNKQLELAPYVQYTHRADLSGSDAAYGEVRFGLQSSLNQKSWGLEASTSLVQRNYQVRKARLVDAEAEELLRYGFVNITLKPTYQLSKRLQAFATFEYRARLSNSTSTETRFRRGFTNYSMLAGVRYVLKGKRKAKKRS